MKIPGSNFWGRKKLVKLDILSSKTSGTILKPHGGSMFFKDPYSVICSNERQLLMAKKGVLQNLGRSDSLSNAKDVEQFSLHFHKTIKIIFPDSNSILLVKKVEQYTPVSYSEKAIDPTKIDFSSSKSILRAAGDIEPSERRAIYIPDVNGQYIFLASKLDTIIGNDIINDLVNIEEGTIKDSGLKFDLDTFKKYSSIESLAVSPIFEYSHLPPLGSIVLYGKKGFFTHSWTL